MHINMDKHQQLFEAARSGNLTQLENLLGDPEVDVNAQNQKGYTALILASYNNQPEAVKFLLEKGADVNKPDSGGNTALMGV